MVQQREVAQQVGPRTYVGRNQPTYVLVRTRCSPETSNALSLAASLAGTDDFATITAVNNQARGCLHQPVSRQEGGSSLRALARIHRWQQYNESYLLMYLLERVKQYVQQRNQSRMGVLRKKL